MELIADGLLLIASMVAALYCLILSRRLRRLTRMEGGLGKAITTMSTQVDEMKAVLSTSQKATAKAIGDLDARLAAAKTAAAKLEATAAAADDAAETLKEAAARAEAAPKPAARKTAARKPRAKSASKSAAARKPATRKAAGADADADAPAPDKKTVAQDPAPVEEAASARETSVIAAVDEILSTEGRDDHDLLARRLTAAIAGEGQTEAAGR
ncbi:hypothetical protein [Pikeienuella sp. HZG-20]|uniref:hypothetical protein n=1 Tax=Paludibacillus litoralis TaxID=3133267 RepID=UPI0030ECAF85